MEDQYTEQLKMAPLFEPLKIDEEKQMCNAFCCKTATDTRQPRYKRATFTRLASLQDGNGHKTCQSAMCF